MEPVFLTFSSHCCGQTVTVKIAVSGCTQKGSVVNGKDAKSDRDFKFKAFKTLDNYYVSQNYRPTSKG